MPVAESISAGSSKNSMYCSDGKVRSEIPGMKNCEWGWKSQRQEYRKVAAASSGEHNFWETGKRQRQKNGRRKDDTVQNLRAWQRPLPWWAVQKQNFRQIPDSKTEYESCKQAVKQRFRVIRQNNKSNAEIYGEWNDCRQRIDIHCWVKSKRDCS